MGNVEFVTVKVQIGNQTRTVKMQKGTSFENKGGIFTADKDGATVKMTNYQMKVFEAVANNTKERGMGDGVVLSAEDIKSAQQKFKQGGFVADMSEFLPDGYKIERPKISTNDKYIEAYVTNGKESQSATLRFSYGVTGNNTTNNSNIQSRLLPTSKDSKKYNTKQSIKVTNNNDGSVTYKLPKQYWGDDGIVLGVQTTEYTVKDGNITKLQVTYFNNTDYKTYTEDVKIEDSEYEKKYQTYTWENGVATHLDSEFDIHTGKFHDIERKHQVPLHQITDCNAKMLREGSFAKIMENNPIGWGHVWPGRNQ